MKLKPRLKVRNNKSGSFGGLTLNQRMQMYYEGASSTYRMGNKGKVGGGANTNITKNLYTLRSRSRYVIANHALGETAVTSYVANVVGKGFTAKFKNKDLQALWDPWTEECDADGLSNLNGITELLCRSEFGDGEVMLRRRQRRESDGLTVPLQLQTLECDHLDETFNDQSRRIDMGIQFDALGRRQGYHLFKSHPGERSRDLNGRSTMERTVVPANDIIHLFRRLRPGQNRGVPKLSNILLRLYEIDEMQDGILAKQKIAQLFGWIVKRPSPESSDLTQESNTLGEDVPDGEPQQTEDGTVITKIKAGGVHYLDEGEEIDFSAPEGIGSNYIEWLKTELRVCAKAVGLTYEQFTGDLTGVNYTSIRAGLIEFRRAIEQVQYNLYVFRLMRTVAIWFMDAAVMSGKIKLDDYWTNKAKYMPSFMAQGWEWVDPVKDRMAELLDVRAGFNSRRNVVASRGLDIEEVNDHLLEDQDGDLILESIAGKTAKNGSLHGSKIEEDPEEGEDPEQEELPEQDDESESESEKENETELTD